MMAAMRLLGIDPGTATVGYGVLDAGPDYGATLVACGVITTSPRDTASVRLATVYQDLQELLATYRPGVVVVEKLFAFRNVTTVIGVAQARGVILLACEQAGAALAEYTPMEAKLTIAGYGKASKREVQEAVRDQLMLATVPRPDDAADALAFALTHLRYLESLMIPVSERAVRP